MANTILTETSGFVSGGEILFETGTHWMSNILHFLKTDSLESPKTAPIIELFTIEEIASWPSPRILHTHTFPYFLPEGSLKAGRKTVLMYRNPKDTAVSMFHHFRQNDGMGGKLTISWKCFFKTWVRGIAPPCDFFCYFDAWQKIMQENSDVEILVVHFEDMKRNGLAELRRIQEYLGLSHSDERLQQVLDRCSISKLRADVNDKKVKTVLVDDNGRSILYRKGIIGDWKNHFTVAQSEQFDARIEERFKNSIFNRHMPA